MLKNVLLTSLCSVDIKWCNQCNQEYGNYVCGYFLEDRFTLYPSALFLLATLIPKQSYLNCVFHYSVIDHKLTSGSCEIEIDCFFYIYLFTFISGIYNLLNIFAIRYVFNYSIILFYNIFNYVAFLRKYNWIGKKCLIRFFLLLDYFHVTLLDMLCYTLYTSRCSVICLFFFNNTTSCA